MLHTTAPESIRTDKSNEFAHHTMSVRLPAILDETIDVNSDYSASVVDSLKRLRDEVLRDEEIRMIDAPAPDWGSWREQLSRHRGETWLHAQWFFAEHLFYRRIIECVRWWETERDPFAPIKAAEYSSEGYSKLLELASEVQSGGPPEARLEALLLLELWGNRIDLSYKASAQLGAAGTESDDLVADDRASVIGDLLGQEAESRSIHIVADNAGSELAMDLLVADSLISLGFSVALHVKMHPTYVSDATASDVRSLIRMLAANGSSSVEALGNRLGEHFSSGSLRIHPDLYWNSGRFIDELPPRLSETFRGARLVVFKGDANYRRLTRDALWAPDASFADVLGRFPAPMLLLRTMKSDTVFGLSVGVAPQLDAADPAWKTNGRRGLIQYFR